MTSQPPDDPHPPQSGGLSEPAPVAPPSPGPAKAPMPSPADPSPLPPTGAAVPPPPAPPMFQPVPRPPRVPWVNPARRSHLAGAALAGAIVLLGAGFGIGYAASPDDHGRGGSMRMERGGGFPPGHRDGRLGPFPGRQFPGNRPNGPGPLPGASVAPSTPVPTGTK